MTHGVFSPLSILLVDDDDIIRLTGKALLENSGHQVTCCANGHAALEATDHALFDVVLMDINMPGMHGVETARQIRARGTQGNCPIIALTAGATPDEREDYRSAGLDSVLTKPLRRSNIESLLVNIQARRHTSLPNETRSAETPVDRESSDVLIDRDRLQLLAEALPRQKVRELLQQVSRSMIETATHLRKAWREQDRLAMVNCSHRLAGAAGNFGCESLAKLARKMESDCKSAEIGQSLLQQFEETFLATLAALQKEWEEDQR